MGHDNSLNAGGQHADDASRLLNLSQLVASERYAGAAVMERFCQVAVDVLAVDGAALSLIVDGAHRQPISTFDGRSAEVEELQLTLGEGPCLDAYRFGVPVLVGDLAVYKGRWPAFREAALKAGLGAVFSIPLRAGDRLSLGSLNLYRERTGDLTPGELADSEALAQLVMAAVLALQVEALPGELSELLAQPQGWAEVHQATGMVAARLGVSLEEAFSRLRGRAFAEERTLASLARDVVEGSFLIDELVGS